jgi:hypothetical protein
VLQVSRTSSITEGLVAEVMPAAIHVSVIAAVMEGLFTAMCLFVAASSHTHCSRTKRQRTARDIVFSTAISTRKGNVLCGR